MSNTKPAYNISESQIRYAIANSKSNKTAALFLRVSFATYRKYAMMYLDAASGKTLFDLHRYGGHDPSIKKALNKEKIRPAHPKIPIEDIFSGKIKKYPPALFYRRLLSAQIIPIKCSICDFSERRMTDGKLPLKLDYIDGNLENKSLDNLRFLCLNHFFLLVGNQFKGAKKQRIVF